MFITKHRTVRFTAVILSMLLLLSGFSSFSMASTSALTDRSYQVQANGNGTSVVTATYRNMEQTEKNLLATIQILGDGVINGKDAIAKSIAPGATETVTWRVKALKGSSKLFVTTEENGVVTTEKVGKVTSQKAGWVSGDIHNHTRYSDGSGTIYSNFAQAQKVGMDFINIADHSNSRGWADAQIAGPQYELLPIRGNEYSHRTYAHSVFMNVNQEKNYSTLLPWLAVDSLKADTLGQALSYIAHPYDGSGSTADPWTTNRDANGTTAFDLAKVDGIEVWNGWYASHYPANVKARAKWDEMNKEGRHLYGIADTDAHSSIGMGELYTTVLASDYSVEGILNGFRAGHMYGSNGPVIDFSIGNVMMGDDMAVRPEGKKVSVRMSGEYLENLNRVLLIKNGEVVYTQTIDGKSFHENVKIDVKPGDFIRMEVEGHETDTKKLTNGSYSTSAYFTSAPFAFSNPIFFTEK